MSTPSEPGSDKAELDLDLQLLPAWAQKPPEENKYAKYEGGAEDRFARRGPRSRRSEPPRGHPAFRKERMEAGKGGGRPPQPKADIRPEPKREWTAPRIEVTVGFIPEEKGVESLARQIRLTGRAYPLFGIAALILRRPDRYHVRFSVVKTPQGEIAQPLFVCALDDTLWLSEQDAVDHVLNKHFSTFYQAERVPTDPPKGTYTFVAQCGLSGTILGPPNYHDYQNKLRRLHGERFSQMPFEAFKARIKIVRDEATVKKWIEEQSWRIEYVCLNVPESAKLPGRGEVEKHFREVHLPNVIKAAESHTMIGTAAQSLRDRALQSLVRRNVEDQLRFPIRVVNVLSQQFAGYGLQFFKVNKAVTHVAVARPHYLDLEATPVSEGIKRIVGFINATPNCTRRKLLESLVPGTPVSSNENRDEGSQSEIAAPSPEAAAVVSDLHWLIHQGHVIEFSNGVLETAKRPIPRPSKPEPSSSPPAESIASPASAGHPENPDLAAREPKPIEEALAEPPAISEENRAEAARPGSGVDEVEARPCVSEAEPDSIAPHPHDPMAPAKTVAGISG